MIRTDFRWVCILNHSQHFKSVKNVLSNKKNSKHNDTHGL